VKSLVENPLLYWINFCDSPNKVINLACRSDLADRLQR